MTVNAGRYIVEIKELSWWERQEIQSKMVSGAKVTGGGEISGIDGQMLLDIKVETFSKSIVSIKGPNEEIIPFSIEWLKGLTEEEGNELSEKVDELAKKK